MFWKRNYFHSILFNSKKIIFISPGYKKTFLELLPNKFAELDQKIEVIPNGINSYYLNDKPENSREINSPVRIVYAGAINKGKNIIKTIDALKILKKKGYLIEFKIVGKGLKFRREDKGYLNEILKTIKDLNWISLLDSLPKEELRDLLDVSDIFAMPSSPETFGIIYLEALSRNLPIIYAKEQGFDGYFKDGLVGFAVNPKCSTEIADRIERIIINYDQIINNVQGLSIENDFSWDRIANKYLKIYNQII
jgi:glycosyltransferase involved in cell wall biosynthesis